MRDFIKDLESNNTDTVSSSLDDIPYQTYKIIKTVSHETAERKKVKKLLA